MNAYSSPSPSGSSDVFEIADGCIERVREVAGLDAIDVLPPLPVVAPRREVVMLLQSDVADGSAHRPPGAATSHARELVTTHRTKRPTPPGSGWAIALCALLAVGAAGASFLVSPMGHEPSVVRVTEAARLHARHAVRAVVATASAIRR